MLPGEIRVREQALPLSHLCVGRVRDLEIDHVLSRAEKLKVLMCCQYPMFMTRIKVNFRDSEELMNQGEYLLREVVKKWEGVLGDNEIHLLADMAACLLRVKIIFHAGGENIVGDFT